MGIWGWSKIKPLHFTVLQLSELTLYFTSLHITAIQFTSLLFTEEQFTALHVTEIHFIGLPVDTDPDRLKVHGEVPIEL